LKVTIEKYFKKDLVAELKKKVKTIFEKSLLSTDNYIVLKYYLLFICSYNYAQPQSELSNDDK